MNEHIPIANPVKPKKKKERVKHFAEYGTGEYTSETLWIKCGIRKGEGEIVEYIKDLRTSIETRNVIGHWCNWTQDPREVTCKRCKRSIKWKSLLK